MLTRALTIALCSALPLSASARGQDGLRWVALFEETANGAKVAKPASETELMRVLLDAGLVFVDETQAGKIRSVTSAGTLIAGSVPDTISAIDADLIIAGVTTLTRVETNLLGKEVFRCNGIIDATIIRVDNAEVVASLSVKSQGLGYDIDRAAHNAATAAAKELAAKIVERLPLGGARRRIELSIAGIPDVARAESLIRAIAGMPRVTSAKMLRQAPEESKLAVEYAAGGSRELAVALDAAGIAGLTVYGYSDSAIKAQYSIARTIQLRLKMAIFRSAGKQDLLGKALPEMIGTALSSSSMFVIPAGEEASPVDVRKLAQKSAPDAAVVLFGNYSTKKDRVDISAHLAAISNGARIAGADTNCPEDELAGCISELASRLERAFAKRFDEHRKLFTAEPASTPRAITGAVEERPLDIMRINVEGIFPGRLATYTDRPIGQVRLKNLAREKLSDLILHVRVGGFTSAPLVTRLGDLPPGAHLDAPIKVLLDRQVLESHDENHAAALTVEVEYGHGHFRVRETGVAPILIYDRNAMSWKEPATAAAFITPRAEEILRLARAFRAAVPANSGSDPRAVPIALFRGLKTFNLQYAPDPSSPFGGDTLDYLQYPLQTLEAKSGDCDDLAVLFAAIAEAVGVQTLLLTTPDHVFTAVATDLPPRSAHLLTADAKELVVHDGRLWIPLETTKIQHGFEEAWAAAAVELERWKKSGKLSIIDVREAWKKHPSQNLAKSAALGEVDAIALHQSVEAELSKLEARRRRGLEAQLEGASASKQALLFAQLGREAEARAILEELIAKQPKDEVALNNLGNVHLNAGRSKDALVYYRRALAAAPKARAISVRINTALAALVSGDKDAFSDQIVACLELGAEREVLDLARAGYGGAPGLRGAGAAALADRDLVAGVIEAFARAKRPPPSLGGDSKGESSETRDVGRFVYWLSP